MKRERSAAEAGQSAATVEQAAALHQSGQHEAAESAYRALLEGPAPQRRGVLPLLGLLYRQSGRRREALAVYDQLVAMGERSGEVFLIRGDLLHGLGRNVEALQSYDRAAASDSTRPQALNNRGVALVALGRPIEALSSYDAALAVRPDYAEALFNRGVALADLGRVAAALESYEQVTELQPGHARAHNNLGLVLAEQQRWPEALERYDRAIAAAPDYADAFNNRSVCLRALGRLEAALESADRALALRPASPEALNTRGLALAALTQFETALESYHQALALRPDYPQALSNSGVALVALGRPDAALARYEAALRLDPGFAEAEFNIGLTRLRLGDFEGGWRRHEARFRRRGQPTDDIPKATLWLGSEDVSGQTVLLHAEQGLGDTLQFCRFAPEMAERGARVVLQVQPQLQRLLGGLTGVDAVISTQDEAPAFDRHVPLMSLPLALGTTLDTIPDAPYLAPDAALTNAWRARLGRREKLRVGLAWSGNPVHENDRQRSIPLQALTPLAECEVEFVSLQQEIRSSDSASLGCLPGLQRFPESLNDFAETAALAAACELVISVDTSVAHLAGALGRTVWIMTPRVSDWRWMIPSPVFEAGLRPFDPTPWYRTARLYRQRQFGDWTGVVAEVAQALKQEAARFRAASIS